MRDDSTLLNAVATLPISPRHATIGAYCGPLVTDLLARHTGQVSVICVNLLGRRERGSQQRVIGTFTDRLRRLGITPHLLWRDDEPGLLELAGESVVTLAGRGLITEETEPLFCCGCLALEIPMRAVPRRRQKRHVVDQNWSGLVCRVCGGTAQLTSGRSLYFQFLPEATQTRIQVQPGYADAETQELRGSWEKNMWRISRLRPTGIEVQEGGNSYNLDVDFAWSLMPTALLRSGIQLSSIVTSHRNIFAAIRMMHINNVLGEWQPEFASIVATPTLLGGSGQVMAGAAYNIDWLGQQYEPRPLRLWMTLGLNWSRKQARLPSRDLHWCLLAVGSSAPSLTPPTPSGSSAEDFLQTFSAREIQAAAVSSRKGHPMSVRGARGLATVLQVGDDRAGYLAPALPGEARPGTINAADLPASARERPWLIADARRRQNRLRRRLAEPFATDGCGVSAEADEMWLSLESLLRLARLDSNSRADALTTAYGHFPGLFTERQRMTLRLCLDTPAPAEDVGLSGPQVQGLMRDFLEVHDVILSELLALASR
jgi:hypothetical protein